MESGWSSRQKFDRTPRRLSLQLHFKFTQQAPPHLKKEAESYSLVAFPRCPPSDEVATADVTTHGRVNCLPWLVVDRRLSLSGFGDAEAGAVGSHQVTGGTGLDLHWCTPGVNQSMWEHRRRM
jgi:hypothetical protein